MTKLEIMNLIKQQMHEAKYHYDYRLDKYGEDDARTYMAYGEYYTLKWLLMDIEEKDLLEKIDKDIKEIKEALQK